MEIDKRLNLVLTVEQENGLPFHVHSTPISRDVFKANFRLITKAMVMMIGDDLGTGGQVRVAAFYLKEAAKELDGPAGDRFQKAADALMLEINRLSMVVIPGERGWESLPLQDALNRKMLTEDQKEEVENSITFFSAASWFNSRKERLNLYLMLKGYGAETSSSDCTAYVSSLPTSMPAESTGATAPQSSIPH